MQDKTTLIIDAYNNNFSDFTDKIMNHSPCAMHVIDFAGLLEDGSLDDDEANAVLTNAVKWLRSGGYLYLSFMEGKQSGFETTSFSTQLWSPSGGFRFKL